MIRSLWWKASMTCISCSWIEYKKTTADGISIYKKDHLVHSWSYNTGKSWRQEMDRQGMKTKHKKLDRAGCKTTLHKGTVWGAENATKEPKQLKDQTKNNKSYNTLKYHIEVYSSFELTRFILKDIQRMINTIMTKLSQAIEDIINNRNAFTQCTLRFFVLKC